MKSQQIAFGALFFLAGCFDGGTARTSEAISGVDRPTIVETSTSRGLGATNETCGFDGAATVSGDATISGQSTVTGNLAASGKIRVNGKGVLNGDATAGSTVEVSGQSEVTGASTEGATVSVGASVADVLQFKSATNDNGTLTAALSGPHLELSAPGGTQLAAGDYYFDTVKIDSQATLTSSGRVRIYVAGSIEVTGQAQIELALGDHC